MAKDSTFDIITHGEPGFAVGNVLFNNEKRLERVARILTEEWRYQRYGFVPDTEDMTLSATFLAMARMALLAADNDEESLERVRSARATWSTLILDDQTSTERNAVAER